MKPENQRNFRSNRPLNQYSYKKTITSPDNDDSSNEQSKPISNMALSVIVEKSNKSFRNSSNLSKNISFRDNFLNKIINNTKSIKKSYLTRSKSRPELQKIRFIGPPPIKQHQIQPVLQYEEPIEYSQNNLTSYQQQIEIQPGIKTPVENYYLLPPITVYEQQKEIGPTIQPTFSKERTHKNQNTNLYPQQTLNNKSIIKDPITQKSIQKSTQNLQTSLQSFPYYVYQQPPNLRAQTPNVNYISYSKNPLNNFSYANRFNTISNSEMQPNITLQNNQPNIVYNTKTYNELNKKYINNIVGYGAKTCNGAMKGYNEDRIKVITDVYNSPETKNSWKVSYFAIYDGHAGDKCCEFIKKNFHNYIFRSSHFPNDPLKAINDAFKDCEKDFINFAYQNSQLIDRSGCCVLIALFINGKCYVINLGDSRALYSCNSGSRLYQLTRDHRPENEKERLRITQNGGYVYRDTLVEGDGVTYDVGNVDLGSDFKFPYRIYPGDLSVSIL